MATVAALLNSSEDHIFLTAAFQRCWEHVSFAFADSQSKEAQDVQEVLATLILNFADERDPLVLSNQVLKNLPPSVAQFIRIE